MKMELIQFRIPKLPLGINDSDPPSPKADNLLFVRGAPISNSSRFPFFPFFSFSPEPRPVPAIRGRALSACFFRSIPLPLSNLRVRLSREFLWKDLTNLPR